MKTDNPCEAKMEPFDSFWEAPDDIERGFKKFAKFYQRNYFRHLQVGPTDRVLVVSCGPGYFLKTLEQNGISNILGIDSDPAKINYAKKKNLNAKEAKATEYLKSNNNKYDVIVLEQEINHLTKDGVLSFLSLCHRNLNVGGRLVVHSLNGANPITGAEALAQNFDHFNTFTEYSLSQILEYCDFHVAHIFPLNLYIFYENPLNYAGLFVDTLLQGLFRLLFVFYGKHNRLFSKKIGAIGIKKSANLGHFTSSVTHILG